MAKPRYDFQSPEFAPSQVVSPSAIPMPLTPNLKCCAISLGLLLLSATVATAQTASVEVRRSPLPKGVPGLWLSPRILPIPQLSGPRLTFKSQQLDKQLQVYQQYLAIAGPPDVLIVGSSRALAGIDPIALQQALAKQGRPGIRVFNFGVNGATAQVVDLVLQKILTPEQLPQLIIWGDGVRAFNSGRLDVTYNGVLSSPAYQQLIAQGTSAAELTKNSAHKACMGISWDDLAKQVASQPLSALLLAAFTRQGMVASIPCNHSLPVAATTTTFRPEAIEAAWSQISSTLLAPSSWSPPSEPKAEKTSWNQFSGELEQAGFLAISTQFDPKTYYQTHPRVAGEYDGDYRDFNLEGEQTTALQRVIEFTRSRQIPLVFVNLPLTGHYLDPARTAFEQEFGQMMVAIADQQSFLFRNLNQPELSQNGYFIDPSHLNRYGAVVIANQLAQDSTLPWSGLSPRNSAASKTLTTLFQSTPLDSLFSLLAADWMSGYRRLVSRRPA